MDGQGFDTLTRQLTTVRSRRRALKALGGGAVAAALGGLGLREAAAADVSADAKRCRKVTERCHRTSQCCGDVLYCGTTGRANSVCCKPGGAPCSRDSECCGLYSYCDPTLGYCYAE
jgi:hypothetical protein